MSCVRVCVLFDLYSSIQHFATVACLCALLQPFIYKALFIHKKMQRKVQTMVSWELTWVFFSPPLQLSSRKEHHSQRPKVKQYPCAKYRVSCLMSFLLPFDCCGFYWIACVPRWFKRLLSNVFKNKSSLTYDHSGAIFSFLSPAG